MCVCVFDGWMNESVVCVERRIICDWEVEPCIDRVGGK